MLQTDLIMVARLGEEAITAHGVILRTMLIDTIVALAVGPVVSVLVANAGEPAARCMEIRNAMASSFWLGSGLMLLGFLAYPGLAHSLSPNEEVFRLAASGLQWLVLSIPLRFAAFIGTMVYNGAERGTRLYPLYGCSVLANGLLNWLLMSKAGGGFAGCYLSTFLVALLQCLYVVRLVMKQWPGSGNGFRLNLAWVSRGLAKSGAEVGRVASVYLFSYVCLFLVLRNTAHMGRASAYIVASEFSLLLAVGCLVMMRSTAIVLANRLHAIGPSHLYQATQHLLTSGLAGIVPVGLCLLFLGERLGVRVYHLGSEAMIWWRPYLFMAVLFLPLNYCNALQRGIWQALQQYKRISLIECFSLWGLGLPFFALGLYFDHPWLAWASLNSVEVLIGGLLWYCWRRAGLGRVVTREQGTAAFRAGDAA